MTRFVDEYWYRQEAVCLLNLDSDELRLRPEERNEQRY